METNEPASSPMPPEGNLTTAAMWLIGTALCTGFFISALFLLFDLAAAGVPTAQVTREAAYCAVLGALTVLHVVLAVQLRWGKGWARRGVMAVEAGAIIFCAYVVVSPFTAVPEVPVLGVVHGLLGIVLHLCVLVAVSTEAMRHWCTQHRAAE
ncbi:hypothetical protein GALLR39Z86_39860 [Glycomyces algeriensis]|uniref:Uncharacterized protein n=1 Tax=Glycomyces algeriensis TaxID=256037 RepID=A0A9W6GBS4_9ACTN|nr:hypothetical protein GALLR39Z86_39860 [Glycomyces algeriensis]